MNHHPIMCSLRTSSKVHIKMYMNVLDKAILTFCSNTLTHHNTLLGTELVFPDLSPQIPKCITVPIVKGLIAT